MWVGSWTETNFKNMPFLLRKSCLYPIIVCSWPVQVLVGYQEDTARLQSPLLCGSSLERDLIYASTSVGWLPGRHS